MALISLSAPHIRAITTSVPSLKIDNINSRNNFDPIDVKKIVQMAGVRHRYVSGDSICSSDLCEIAALDALKKLEWRRESIDALIMVTQSPDYILPSTACILQHKLGLPSGCAAFDIGLGCSGYTYGLMIAASIMQGQGIKRVILLHGETPSRFAHPDDRSVALLFGDAGSATALEKSDSSRDQKWYFCLHTDGNGYDDLIIKGGGFRYRLPEDPMSHYVHMNGSNIFNFTIKRVPPLVSDTLRGAGKTPDQIDYFILHQSNQFIMRHLLKKIGVPEEKAPFTIGNFGSTGGPSVPLTITNGQIDRPQDRALELLLISYGVGLSWGSALVDLEPDAILGHLQYAEERGDR